MVISTSVNSFKFRLIAQAQKSAARAGEFTTLHSTVQTPVFMPVGTQATIKGLRVEEIKDVGTQVMLANTYHLLIRPGREVFERLGGIHKMMNWPGSVLTDSGGFQIFSLAHARQMSEEGATFSSHVDGKKVLLTPESSIAMQRAIGSDIMMVLDQCIPSTADHGVAKAAMELTHRWARRSLLARGESPQALFAIVQGALDKSLRRQSAHVLGEMNFDGYAIGGLAVGETKQQREEFTVFTAELLPRHKPRYLMGVGTPIDLLEAVHRGVDMFDCIIPTALSQHGVAFTSKGKKRLMRSVYKFADEPVDPNCDCVACKNYSKGYLHHLHKASEPLGWHLTSVHNLRFYHTLMRRIRQAIIAGTFGEFYREHQEILTMQDEERPAVPPPPTKSDKRVNTLGAFAVNESKAGFTSIRHIASGEVMHPMHDPNKEAEELYIQQSCLGERLKDSDPSDLVMWDVGLGAAYNAMAAIRKIEAATDESPTTKRRVQIVSFENDLDALKLAALNVSRFSHLKHPAPHYLLKDGVWNSTKAPLQWRLLEGSFLDRMSVAPAPHIIYFDPFSYKTDHEMWTLGTFEKIFKACGAVDTELFNYTVSTRVRAALLVAGFFVAKGASTGAKSETTIALTEMAMQRRQSAGLATELLSADWMGRWERSDAKFPDLLNSELEGVFSNNLKKHRQFSVDAV